MSSPQPDITLYFLGASRAIRIAWLLEELKLPYHLEASSRGPDNLARPEFKEKIPAILKKSPTLKDGNIVVQESGAITEYLCDTYDPQDRLIPKDPQTRAKVREWIAAAEGTFCMHSISILYVRLRIPEAARSHLPDIEKVMSPNVQNDLKMLEAELTRSASGGSYLIGNHLTAADIMMHFSIQFLFKRKLGTLGQGNYDNYPHIKKWMGNIENTDSYRRAVEKSGYSLD